MSVETSEVEPRAQGDEGKDAGVVAEITSLGARAGELIESLTGAQDPEVRAQVEELLSAIDILHREALLRLTAVLASHHLLEEACRDRVIDLVLDLYELTPAQIAAAAAPAASAPATGSSGFVKIGDLRPLPVRQVP
ncbi:MAG: hypothetical protein ACYDAC_05195 [Candidatus Dormibacteria bacterium]